MTRMVTARPHRKAQRTAHSKRLRTNAQRHQHSTASPLPAQVLHPRKDPTMESKIRVKCKCDQALAAPRSKAGTNGKCPRCGALVAIPRLPDRPMQDLQRTEHRPGKSAPGPRRVPAPSSIKNVAVSPRLAWGVSQTSSGVAESLLRGWRMVALVALVTIMVSAGLMVVLHKPPSAKSDVQKRVERLLADMRGSDPEVRQKAVDALVEMGVPAVESLIVVLGGRFLFYRQPALDALAEIGEEAVDPLLAALGDPTRGSKLRQHVAQALGEIKSAKALPHLVAALDDEDGKVAERAVVALVAMGHHKAVDMLIAVMTDRDRTINSQRSAAHALAGFRDPKATAALVAALDDQDAKLAEAAAEALRGTDDLQALKGLIAVLDDTGQDTSVRSAAAQALAGSRCPGASAALAAALDDENVEVAEAAATALGGTEDLQAVGRLIDILRDVERETRVRATAAQALGRTDYPGRLEPLTAALKDKDTQVAISAATALGNTHDPKAVDALGPLLWDRKLNADLRRTAAGALGRIKHPSSVGALKCVLSDFWVEVQGSAVQALRAIGGPEALEAVAQYEKRREERKRSMQPQVTKECSRCGKRVSMSSKAGQKCPHCNAYWSSEIERQRQKRSWPRR